MESSDLMIGDWVYNTMLQGYTRVKVLTARGIKGDIHDNIWDEDTFAPIPLTPEILEKNGFETKDNAHYYIAGKIIELLLEEHPFIGYSIHWVKTIDTINPIGQQCFIDYYIANLEYVHELRHCLKLVGIEKEIEL